MKRDVRSNLDLLKGIDTLVRSGKRVQVLFELDAAETLWCRMVKFEPPDKHGASIAYPVCAAMGSTAKEALSHVLNAMRERAKKRIIG